MRFIFFSNENVEKKNKISFVFGLLLLVGLFLLVVILPNAYACTCIGDWPIEDRVDETDIIFSGKLLERIEDTNQKTFIFKIDKLWKDNSDKIHVEQKNMTIFTPFSEAACGTDFIVGLDYLVYAEVYGNTINTSLCSGSDRLFLKTDDLKFLSTSNEEPIFGLDCPFRTHKFSQETQKCEIWWDSVYVTVPLIVIIASAITISSLVIWKYRKNE